MTAKTRIARYATLQAIERAQAELYAAAQASCDLQGWADIWQEIGNHADATKRLWHKVNDAPLPTGHDGEETALRDARAALLAASAHAPAGSNAALLCRAAIAGLDGAAVPEPTPPARARRCLDSISNLKD